MNIHDLKLFVTAYNERSINKTAITLGYAQSNVTARIKSIETEFNTTFFYRNSKGIIPTADGTKMYAYAVMVLTKTEELKRSFETVKTKHVLTSEMLFNYIVLYTKLYPFEQSQFDIKTTTEIVDDSQLDYDIIFTYFTFKNKNYTIFKQGTMHAQFMQSISHNNSIRHPFKLPVFINRDRSCPFRRKTLEIIHARERIVEIDSLATIVQLVERNKGIALLPEYLKKEMQIQRVDLNTYSIGFYMLSLNK
ncbi:MAG: LysR family transcriptional regulator [Sporolactobacillus sp.]